MDDCINFSEEEVRLRRKKRFDRYAKLLQDIRDKEVEDAINLLEENGYTVISNKK